MNNRLLYIFLLILSFSIACSTSKETTSDTQNDGQEVYVFDDVSNVDTISHEAIEVVVAQEVETPVPTTNMETFIVQVGAFSTIEKANNYVTNVKDKISYQLNVIPNEKVGLFLVQLSPFNSRGEAEKVRNDLWNIPQFADAFIVPK